MKAEIHPKYEDTTITCACGAVLSTGSTAKDVHVEVCSSCHPFFTGTEKVIDTAGRVEKFKARSAAASAAAKAKVDKKAKADKKGSKK